ncbi:cytochrome c [Marinobacterium halophilum]|uniref:Cytochrome c n=1 Tax=Marinobacterium halophilum TaxID=267374 RepID=A0A2P8EUQ1_9GAMM|nr:c-type cytochrome [Marinobacterium halophilum]PSL13196.1 cytochrome c [Marinobacterium halophilum]
MFKLPETAPALLGVGVLLASLSLSAAEPLGIGRMATADEIAGWDIDVRPDGQGLPPGQGSVMNGELLYESRCASCHGSFGEGIDRWPVLAGGYDTLTLERPTKTVGSYWPYASTLWDYIYRAMPFSAPRSLSVDETYAVSAYVLYLNDIVDDDFVLTQGNLARIEMPNREGFFVDNRPDSPNTRCMQECARPDQLEMVGTIGGITPVGHFRADVDAPAASHDAQKSLEDQKEEARLRALGVEVDETVPAAVALSDEAKAGQAVYEAACVACHATGLAGAPKVGDHKAWGPRIDQGVSVLIRHAIEGFTGKEGVMPAKGGRMDLTDQQVSRAVAFMTEKSQ